MKRMVLAVILGTLTSACAAAQAKAPADRPTLEVPAPPPKTIEPTPKPEPAAAPEPVSDLPTASPPTPSRPSRPAPRDTPRTEPKPPETPPAEQPAAPPPPVAPAPQLRTPGTADSAEAAKQVRDMIDRAQKSLGTVDYQRLNNAQRGQYKNAQLMLTQAEEQLKGSNFEIARNNADKAARIAAELGGR
jgi:outer membrane biosynthesis protein TonB